MKRNGGDTASSFSKGYCSDANIKCVVPFDVYPVARFDLEFPHFRLPSELGCFSLDPSREYVDNRSHLRVYSPPSDGNIAWDLSHGYSVFVQRDESKKEYTDHLLKWIQLHRHHKFPSPTSNNDLSM